MKAPYRPDHDYLVKGLIVGLRDLEVDRCNNSWGKPDAPRFEFVPNYCHRPDLYQDDDNAVPSLNPRRTFTPHATVFSFDFFTSSLSMYAGALRHSTVRYEQVDTKVKGFSALGDPQSRIVKFMLAAYNSLLLVHAPDKLTVSLSQDRPHSFTLSAQIKLNPMQGAQEMKQQYAISLFLESAREHPDRPSPYEEAELERFTFAVLNHLCAVVVGPSEEVRFAKH